MKNQRMKTEARSFGFSTLAIVLLMLATIICSFTVMASAETTQITIAPADLDFGTNWDSKTATYTKEYDGTTDVTVALTQAANQRLQALGVTVTPSAVLNDPDVADAKTVTVSFTLSGANASQYQAPASFSVGASVTPKELDWNGAATATTTFAYTNQGSYQTSYEVGVTLPTLNKPNGVNVAVDGTYKVVVNGVDKAGTYKVPLTVKLNDTNYVAEELDVSVTVEKIKITKIEWAANYEFEWGDPAANAIQVYGYDAKNNAYELGLEFKANYGEVGTHEITAVLPDSANLDWALTDSSKIKGVEITKKKYTVGMEDVVYIGNKGIQADPTKYDIAVSGELPADIRALIEYTANGSAFAATDEYGSYTVTAKLPASDNYYFVNAAGEEVTSLTATMYINKQYVHAGSDGAEDYEIILVGSNGFTGDVKLTVTIPDALSRKAIKGLPVYKSYKVSVEGAADQTFTVLIPISDSLYHNNCDDLTADDLYIYEDATGTKVKASEKSGYTVTLNDGYYSIEGVSGSAAVTFILAPSYNTPFWLSPIGIALLILLILLLIFVLPFIIGMYLRRIRNTDENPVLVVDEGEVPEVEPVEPEDNVDEEAFLAETADEIAEGIDTEAETEETEAEGVEEVVEESMQEMLDEAAAIEDEVVEEAAETDVAEELAEDKAEELADTVEADDAEAEADEDAIREAVEEALADINESADATDAVELVEEPAEDEAVEAFAEVEVEEKPESEEDDDNDNDDDDDNEGFGGFGSMPLDFIDAVAEADKYAEMLEQESRGEIQIVTRYRRSFQSRLIQSQGNVQDYYSILKNALLSYKGVKNRISWNYEAFNRGRTHVAKINAKTKTLYLYLALDPEELKDTKYGIVDMSSKKKYASVPVLMKIKGERKFKYALELIAKLCGENLELPKLEVEEVDYHVPYQTTEELVEAGVVRKLVASIPVAAYGEETPAEDSAASENTVSAATEAQEITFIEPTTAPAVEAAAEEVAAEEAAAAEATHTTEEVPADAPASEDEPKEV